MATYTDNYNLVKPTMAETADIRTINGNMDSVDNIMHATQVSLAPAYDQNETYNTGDIVMYEFLMYECLDDEVTGTWDATKWQRTTAGEHGGGGGGSNVSITPTLQRGTKIADFEIDGVEGELYAPNGGGGGGGSDGVIEGLDYDRAETLTLPDFTGYTYTPAEDGVLMLRAYGGVGGVTVLATGYDDLSLAVLGDTWTCPWIPVNKGTEYTLKRMAQSSGFPSGSWIKFIPWKRGVFLAPMIYSTEEREVGAWVDDKPLYQKTLIANYTSGVSSGAHVVESIADIEIVNGFGSYVESSGYVYTMPYAEGTGTSFYYYDGDVVFSTGSSMSFASGTLYLTIQYTKDSDVAGSGSYGSLGVPMEHYDNTEKVVGTWFGETLYAKSYDIDNPSSNASIITEDFSDKVITDITAIGIRSSDGAIIPLQFTTTNNWMRVYAGTIYSGVYLESNIALSNIKITIKYTKSTT